MDPSKEKKTPPESVEVDGALVILVSRVEQLGGDDGSITKGGGLAADFLAVQHDVLAMSSDEEQCELSLR